ncbi:tRNA methyltransferase complex GCD14 subunit-domain-containing protein [Gamsiella multidivaricata]|uniref:tRNA methyltransferase complex GCD14 subunit-domain-containing protein n=1 Tax=Gamsiella multidivaricata TaxID=101098 RepID=UPI0022204AAE|nr:tRNA methyltransferase complex GCD14 subunit-domain-containing protein [Gamsiella multidivaricata]KAG0371015.1 tRNA (adenine-N(1)-)-methyltransferase catalytic subunit trm61 [Gamsiella multidivaricata]KAI7831576.1 tRNA methyltransferase complex GCD14 subunit-domain-containing protein [Gamsiella multidivaricata]
MSSTSIEKQSFVRYKSNNTIEDGDLVVVYLSRENMSIIRVKEGEYFNCKFGSYKHADMIGLQYGTKLGSNTGRGFLYLLHPTPELWTLVLPHRTQILYIADISFVMNFLNLKPGMSMIESGTGSGSFSHSIARTLAPTGHLYTFEYHQERVNAAKKEFEQHGLSDMVTLQCRDVCKDGFGMENKVDAIFLDLPAPWEAVASAKRAFNQDKIGKICTFSPCIEQISRTVTALNEQGFVDIQMYECLIRFNEVRVIPMWTIDEAMERQRAIEKKRKRAVPRVLRENQPASRTEQQQEVEDEERNVKSKSVKVEVTMDNSNVSSTAATPTSTGGSDMEDAVAVVVPSSSPASTTATSSEAAVTPAPQQPSEAEPRERIDPKNITVTKLPVEQRGHTSYLMFATFTPAIQRPNLTKQNAASKK